jgi:halocyanin-like protein
MSSEPTHLSRRTVLKSTAAAGAAAVGASALTGTAAAQDTSVDDWLSDTGNYDGVVDKTGQSEVTIEVGAQANGGPYGFGPAAVRVDPGTKVVWKWVGGTHNVVAKGGSYESKMKGEKGYTFSQTFDSKGVSLYYCTPHKPMGMKGAVVVGDVDVGEGGGGSGSGGSGGGSGGDSGLSTEELGVLGFAGVLSVGLLSPFAAKAFGRDD